MRKLTPITESQALIRSLQSFDNWRGALMPDNPKCQNDINGLIYDYSKTNPFEIYKKFVNVDTSKISQNAINYVRENHNLDRIAEKEFSLYKELSS